MRVELSVRVFDFFFTKNIYWEGILCVSWNGFFEKGIWGRGFLGAGFFSSESGTGLMGEMKGRLTTGDRVGEAVGRVLLRADIACGPLCEREHRASWFTALACLVDSGRTVGALDRREGKPNG